LIVKSRQRGFAYVPHPVGFGITTLQRGGGYYSTPILLAISKSISPEPGRHFANESQDFEPTFCMPWICPSLSVKMSLIMRPLL